MKVSNITVTNYKSIGYDCELPVDRKSTVVVGRSNTGKSNFLHAIRYAFDESTLSESEKCSWRSRSTDENSDIVSVTFDIEEKDYATLGNLSESLIKKKQLTLIKNDNGESKLFFTPKEDESIFLPPDDLRKFLINIRGRTRKMLRSLALAIDSGYDNQDVIIVFDKLSLWLDSVKYLRIQEKEEDQIKQIKTFLNQLTAAHKILMAQKLVDLRITGIKRSSKLIANDVESYIPNIKYIEKKIDLFTKEDLSKVLPQIIFLEGDEDLTIEEIIPINQLKDAPTSHSIKQLLKLTDIDIGILSSNDGPRVDQQLRYAEEKLSSVLSEYWNQEIMKIRLRIKSILKEDEEPVIENILCLDFEDKEEHQESIKDQSPGFRWFLSFTVKHLLGTQAEKDIFLVLDEPGLHLSPNGQADLLERFENSPANIQILYTTHSPFMINKNYPYRIRLFGKGKNDETYSKRGTYINPKPYHSDSGRAWEPIRSGIGLSAGTSLFIAGNNLIVEGISDQIMLSGILQSSSRFSEKVIFDLNKVCICFSGPNNIVPMCLYCAQVADTTAVLLDSDTGPKIKEKLIKKGFKKDNIFLIDHCFSKEKGKKKYIDIEDLFEYEFYHERFLSAYFKIPNFENAKKLPKTWNEIETFIRQQKDSDMLKYKNIDNWGHSKYYTEFFDINKEELGGFNKVIVATEIVDYLFKAEQNEVEKVTHPFINMMSSIWKSQPEWS